MITTKQFSKHSVVALISDLLNFLAESDNLKSIADKFYFFNERTCQLLVVDSEQEHVTASFLIKELDDWLELIVENKIET